MTVIKEDELERGRTTTAASGEQGQEDKQQKRAQEKKVRTKLPSTQPPEPRAGKCTHLASGASSPSRSGPSPHPQGLSCHQSSCRLRACKRLQQMWGGGGEESPEGPLVRTGPRVAASPSLFVPVKALALTHTRPPASQATDSQTNPLPNQGGACSISAFASSSPPITIGG